MKLPEKKRKEMAKKGKRDQPQPSGGGAMGRLRQFEKERGLEGTGLDNPVADESPKQKPGGKGDSE